jgi:hypothetical protein
MALFIGLCCSRPSCFCSNFKRWYWDDMSHTSSVSVVHWCVAHSVTFSHLPLVASSAASMDDLVVVDPGPVQPAVVPVESSTLVEPTPEPREESGPVMPGADGTLQGAVSVEVDGAGPQLGDDAGGLLQDLVR